MEEDSSINWRKVEDRTDKIWKYDWYKIIRPTFVYCFDDELSRHVNVWVRICSILTSNTNSVVHSVFPPIPVLQYVFGEILITNNWFFVFLLFILSQNGFQKTRRLAQFLAFYEPRKKCTVFFGTPCILTLSKLCICNGLKHLQITHISSLKGKYTYWLETSP